MKFHFNEKIVRLRDMTKNSYEKKSRYLAEMFVYQLKNDDEVVNIVKP